ncbi:hypothetical protein [Pyrobaculum aerophilum]|uniref:hypothetical protein n=1 Tax=Pyrobaculum aerophilum TaxID=13773 RepID=UPI0011C08305|nr:hypothetical protein [Pyrobaculum aerophilum]
MQKVALPEAFPPHSKFGMSWGCLSQGAFRRMGTAAAESRVRVVYIRYVLPCDISLKYREELRFSVPKNNYATAGNSRRQSLNPGSPARETGILPLDYRR